MYNLMWQQQSIPLQPGYGYNMTPQQQAPPPPLPQLQQPSPFTQYNPPSSELPISAGPQGTDVTIESSFKRQPNGPILWFAGPPLNVIRETGPVHSLAYLDWKQQQQQQQQQNNKSE
ncbi:unnamed protein product [Mucor hiemalis]